MELWDIKVAFILTAVLTYKFSVVLLCGCRATLKVKIFSSCLCSDGEDPQLTAGFPWMHKMTSCLFSCNYYCELLWGWKMNLYYFRSGSQRTESVPFTHCWLLLKIFFSCISLNNEKIALWVRIPSSTIKIASLEISGCVKLCAYVLC